MTIGIMPKGQGFVEYPVFEQGYEALKQATSEFCDISPAPILRVVFRNPVALIVLRAMLGLLRRNGRIWRRGGQVSP